MPTLQELRDENVNCIQRARDCKTRMGGKEIDQWTINEQEEYKALLDGADKANKAYTDRLALNRGEDRLAAYEASLDAKEERQRKEIIVPGKDLNYIEWNNTRDKNTARRWNNSGKTTGHKDYNAAFNGWLKGNDRPLQVFHDQMAASGMSTDNEERMGYFQTSEAFMTEVIKQVDDSVFVQSMSRVIMMPPAKSLGARVRRSRASSFTWAGENTDTTPTRDTSLAYGKRLLTPNYLQGSIVMSRDLLRNVPQSESMVIEELGIDLNYKLEPAFISGDGNFKPLGLMTAHADGISTGRDFTSSATSFTFDDWTNLKYSLKKKYRSRATFMTHRFVLNQTALLKDGAGRYLWEPSRQIGFPDLILGTPCVETEWMPYAVTSGNYYAILGDFSWYWIVYEMGMEMQRLIELMARTNEYEYLFRCKLDAQPMLEEAFSRGKRA